MLKDIGHPYAEGKEVYDVTFENVQAGERTSHLFRLANLRGGLVVGTGDLSELALGWCTYGVGDHMSHYSVNASVPKTLIQHVIRWLAQTESLGRETSATLLEILATPISPELIPGTSADGASESRHRGDDRARTSCTIFSSTTRCASAIRRRRSRSSRTARGATRTPAIGRTSRATAATSTTSRRSRDICIRSCTASSN